MSICLQFARDKWYVQSSFDTEVLQGKGRCMTASYKYNPVNHNVQVSTAQFNEEWVPTYFYIMLHSVTCNLSATWGVPRDF